ncbi:MAG: hypothetical protein O2888_02580 [Chloroflexi bacterium]|nr:hypothetical protein [Chloroflexota bacterium]
MHPDGPVLAPATIARVAWRDEAGFKKTKSELTTEQSAGVTAAVASPDAKPDSVRTWLEARVKLEMGYTALVAGISSTVDTKAAEAWEKAKEKVLAKPDNATKDPAVVEADWIASTKPGIVTAERRKLDNRVSVTVTNRLAELKWKAAFNNSDGFLPGDRGAGGYGEYYAEPAPSDAPSSGFWGQNRVLQGAGAWWVTADHYKNFVKVTDA